MDINNLWSGYDLNSKKQNSRCLSVNTILEGKYLVGPVLGQGGFGITYVGYDLNMESKIAIKEYFPVELVSRDTTTIHGDHVLSLSGEKSIAYKTGLKKYVAEAQNVSQFSEVPGVVSVKDFFYANETAYIVMEFIDGISLKDYLKEKGGRLTEEEMLNIMKPILEALIQVHKSGIIHRDISPDNIMLVRNAAGQITQVKLIDFGAARMTEKNDQRSLTIILKHGYAPEEQYRTHGEQGPWTDVYALCAVFYRMLTGETPVPAMDRLFKDELKTFEQCGAKVSANTSAAILQGLAVKKEDRIQSVQELIKVLYEGGKVKVSTSKSNKGILVAGIAAVVVLTIGSMALFLGGNSSKGTITNPEENISESVTIAVEQETNKAETEKEIESIEKIEGTENSESTENFLDVSASEDELGEQIVFYTPQNSIHDEGYHILICLPDGTVTARGSNAYGQCNVQDWEHIVSVTGGERHSVGLRSDGTVVAAGENDYGQCDVEHWTNIIQIDAGHTVTYGVTADGKVLSAGQANYYGDADQNVIGSWTDIKRIADVAGIVAGLKYDGTLVVEGTDTKIQVDDWENVVELCPGSNRTLIGIEEDGSLRGVNLRGREMSYDFESFPKMQQFNGYELIGVQKDGQVFCIDELEEEWTELLAVTNGRVAYGLKKDGTILEYYSNRGEAELTDFEDLKQIGFLDGIAIGVNMFAETTTGQKLYYGYVGSPELLQEIESSNKRIMQASTSLILYEDGTLYHSNDEEHEVLPKTGVKQIVVTQEGVSCLMEDGTVEAYALWGRYDLGDFGVDTWKNIVQICGNNHRLIGLTADGRVLDSANGELDSEDIVQIAFSNYNVLGLKSDGTVEVIQNINDTTGNLQVNSWQDITQIAMGESHTVGLMKDGTVVAVGSNHCGQCEVEDWSNVVYIAACEQCTIGLTADGELLIAGAFE